MGLLDAFLKAYQDEGQSDVRKATPSSLFVDKVDKSVSTTATNIQQIVITNKIDFNRSEKRAAEPENPISSASRKPIESTGVGEAKQNVDIVACVRESESTILNSLLKKRSSSTPPPVSSHARASNIVYKISGCDSCPASGHWDGYGQWRMGPGRYCFFTAVFKGKAARPVPIAEAQKACQKANEPELYEN